MKPVGLFIASSPGEVITSKSHDEGASLNSAFGVLAKMAEPCLIVLSYCLAANLVPCRARMWPRISGVGNGITWGPCDVGYLSATAPFVIEGGST